MKFLHLEVHKNVNCLAKPLYIQMFSLSPLSFFILFPCLPNTYYKALLTLPNFAFKLPVMIKTVMLGN